MYYNPITKEKLERNELKQKLNTSFPINAEEINGWFLLHDETYPIVEYGQHVELGEIKLIDDKYTQIFNVIGEPKEQTVNENEKNNLENRLAAIESGLAELALIISEEM